MTDYEKLKKIIDEIDDLIAHYVRQSFPAFEAWHVKAEKFLINKFGKDSLEHKKFLQTSFATLLWVDEDRFDEIQLDIKCCANGLRICKAVFEMYLEDLNDENEVVDSDKYNVVTTNTNKIFIVHGHDGELKHSVARIVEKQGIEAIILSEQANQGKTIIEKFEEYSDVSGAICLFTADDLGRAKANSEERTRARQNVVLETGYFMGKLGRNRTVILADKGIEIPSDLSGVVYTDTTNWQVDLLKELKAMGYAVDYNKLF